MCAHEERGGHRCCMECGWGSRRRPLCPCLPCRERAPLVSLTHVSWGCWFVSVSVFAAVRSISDATGWHGKSLAVCSSAASVAGAVDAGIDGCQSQSKDNARAEWPELVQASPAGDPRTAAKRRDGRPSGSGPPSRRAAEGRCLLLSSRVPERSSSASGLFHRFDRFSARGARAALVSSFFLLFAFCYFVCCRLVVSGSSQSRSGRDAAYCCPPSSCLSPARPTYHRVPQP